MYIKQIIIKIFAKFSACAGSNNDKNDPKNLIFLCITVNSVVLFKSIVQW